jgi:hypothetical protein
VTTDSFDHDTHSKFYGSNRYINLLKKNRSPCKP